MRTKHSSDNSAIQAVSTPSTQRATVVAYVRSGSVFEDRRNNGSAHTVEHLMFQGSKRWPDHRSLQEFLDLHNLTLRGLTTKEYTVFNVQGHTDKVEESCEVLTDIIFSANFGRQAFEREQEILCEEMAQKETDPAHLLFQGVDQGLYKNTPYALPTGGTKDSLAGLKYEDVRSFYDRYYQSDNTVFCLAANKDENALQDIVKKYFSFGNKSETQTYPDIDLDRADLGLVDLTHDTRGDRILLTHAFFITDSYIHQENIIWILAAIINDKLNLSMREKYGLIYQVNVDWHRYSVGNQLDIDIECSVKNKNKVLELPEVELAQIDIDPGWVEQKKSELIQSLQFLPEDSSALADYMSIQKTLFPNYSVETPEQELEKTKNLTVADIVQARDKIIEHSRSGLFMIQV